MRSDVLRRLATRARSVPLHTRVPQLANALLEPLLCRPFGLIHVVEHPKCGGTWVRNMLRSYNGTQAYLADRLIRPHDVIQTHRLYRAWYWRPVVVVRDPRDVFVSQYYHDTHYRRREKGLEIERHFRHDPARPLREDFAAYLEAKLQLRANPSFHYAEFVHSWQNRPRACWVRYEDCLTDAEAELTRILRCFGLPYDRERIRHAVEVNRFENATLARSGRARRPGEADPGEFERKGIAGDWKNHFDARSCELIQRLEGWTLRVLGYERDASWIEPFLAGRG
jgi:hypothetical protein